MSSPNRHQNGCLFVLIMMGRGYFLSNFYYTGGASEFWWVIALVVGAILAFLGSLMVFRAGRYRR